MKQARMSFIKERKLINHCYQHMGSDGLRRSLHSIFPFLKRERKELVELFWEFLSCVNLEDEYFNALTLDFMEIDKMISDLENFRNKFDSENLQSA